MENNKEILIKIAVFTSFALILTCITMFFYIFGHTFFKISDYKYNIYAKKVVQAYNEINKALYKHEETHVLNKTLFLQMSFKKESLESFMQKMDIKKKKDCGLNDKNGGCWWSRKNITNTSFGVQKYASEYYTFIDKHDNAVYVFKDPHWGFLMVYDVNGKDEGPNTRGYDIFYFQTGPDNIEFVPGGEDQLASNARLQHGCFKYKFCTAWVVRTGNMEYMKANERGVCPNGRHLSWYNTKCN